MIRAFVFCLAFSFAFGFVFCLFCGFFGSGVLLASLAPLVATPAMAERFFSQLAFVSSTVPSICPLPDL